MTPFDRLLARTDRIISQVEAGEPIDYVKEAKLDALDVAAAGAHYTVEAIQQSNAEDARLEAQLNEP